MVVTAGSMPCVSGIDQIPFEPKADDNDGSGNPIGDTKSP